MTAEPTQRLSAIDVLGDAGRHASTGPTAALTEPVLDSASIPDAFAAQVARSPHAVAVRYAGRSLSYRELDTAANRLAQMLALHGAGPGRRVALLLPRDAPMRSWPCSLCSRPGRPTCPSTRALGGTDFVRARRCHAGRGHHHRRPADTARQ